MVEDFCCKTCVNGPVQLERLEEMSLGFKSGENLDRVYKFCCLADMVGAGGEAGEASRAG